MKRMKLGVSYPGTGKYIEIQLTTNKQQQQHDNKNKSNNIHQQQQQQVKGAAYRKVIRLATLNLVTC